MVFIKCLHNWNASFWISKLNQKNDVFNCLNPLFGHLNSNFLHSYELCLVAYSLYSFHMIIFDVNIYLIYLFHHWERIWTSIYNRNKTLPWILKGIFCHKANFFIVYMVQISMMVGQYLLTIYEFRVSTWSKTLYFLVYGVGGGGE